MEDTETAQLINLMTDSKFKSSHINEQVKYSSMGSMQKIRSISAKPLDFNVKNLKSDFDDMQNMSNMFYLNEDCIPEARQNNRLWYVLLDVIKNSGRLHKMIDNVRNLKDIKDSDEVLDKKDDFLRYTIYKRLDDQGKRLHSHEKAQINEFLKNRRNINRKCSVPNGDRGTPSSPDERNNKYVSPHKRIMSKMSNETIYVDGFSKYGSEARKLSQMNLEYLHKDIISCIKAMTEEETTIKKKSTTVEHIRTSSGMDTNDFSGDKKDLHEYASSARNLMKTRELLDKLTTYQNFCQNRHDAMLKQIIVTEKQRDNSEEGEETKRMTTLQKNIESNKQTIIRQGGFLDSNINIQNLASKPISKVNSRWKTNPLFHRQTNFVQQNKMNQSLFSKASAANIAD